MRHFEKELAAIKSKPAQSLSSSFDQSEKSKLTSMTYKMTSEFQMLKNDLLVGVGGCLGGFLDGCGDDECKLYIDTLMKPLQATPLILVSFHHHHSTTSPPSTPLSQ